MFKITTASILIILTIFSNSSYAANNAFDDGIKAALQHKQQSINIFKSFNPAVTFKDYTAKPSQSDYYNGVNQKNTTIKEDAASTSSNNEVAKAVNSSFENQKSIDKEALKQEIDRVSKIQDHADNIVRGISDEFVDCTNKESCTTTFEQKQCIDTPDNIQQLCKKRLVVTVVPHQEDTNYTFYARLSVKDHKYAGVVVSAINGRLSFLGPHDATFNLQGLLPSNVDCKKLHGKLLSQSGDAKLDYINFPSCSNQLQLDFHISDGHNKDLVIDMVVSKTTYQEVDHWENDCLGLEHSSCTLQTEECVIPTSTRIIENLPITRECWEKEANYRCQGNAGSNNSYCKPFRDQGCEQINSQCLERTDAGCNKYLQTFQCRNKNCAVTGAICNGQTYCLDGDCVNQQKQADPDFQKAVAALSATGDAAKHLNQNFIFDGKKYECDNVILGAANCCRNEGWLINDVPLIHCSQSEKELGKAKENGTAHYVGQYEDNCAAGICLTKKKVYCVFPTKLARIVQEQGREQQLGRHFGKAKHPECSGLTTEELQKINFSQIDFKEFYEDIAKKQSLETEDKVNKRIQDKMKQFIDQGKSHDKPSY